MAYSLSFLLSSEAASVRMVERKPAYVCHMEVDTMSDTPMQELDADSVEHARTLAASWLTNNRCHSVGIRKVNTDGTLGAADIMDYRDAIDMTETAQSNLDRVMSNYGLVF